MSQFEHTFIATILSMLTLHVFLRKYLYFEEEIEFTRDFILRHLFK